jgi:hypothetical protein
VVNGLANLAVTVKAAREGRPIPPPTTIVSQNPDGTIAVNMPEPPPPPAPDPAAQLEAARRRAEMDRMAQEALRATNIPSWQKVQRNPSSGADEVDFGSSESPPPASGPPVSGGYPPPPVSNPGPPPGPQAAADSQCDPATKWAGAVCQCGQGLFGVPECGWANPDGTGRSDCRYVNWCLALDTGECDRDKNLYSGGRGTLVYWVGEYARDENDPGKYWVMCRSGASHTPNRHDFYLVTGPGLFGPFSGGLNAFRLLSRHTDAASARSAMESAAAQCNQGVRQQLAPSLAHCEPPH